MRPQLKLIGVPFLCLMSCSSVFAYKPDLVSSTPRGVQRGGTHKVVLEGTRLGDSRQLLLDQPGINVINVTPIDDKKVEIEIEVPSSTKPGLYPLRIVTETGLSNVLFLGVGALPAIDEVEPNSDFGSP